MKLLQPIQRVDHVVFQWCMSRRRREMFTALSRAVSKTADGWMYVLFAVAYGFLVGSQSVQFITLFGIAFAIERIIYFIAKNSFRRNRPADAISDFTSFIVPSDKFSFPSGHTSAAFLFAVLVASQFPELLPFLLFWGGLVAISRIFLGVHFPTDTLVGGALGSTVAFFTLSFGGLI